MEYLLREVVTPKASVYSIKGDYNEVIYRYIVSTPETRSICNCPELLGCEYTDLMRDGMTSILEALPFVSHLVSANPEPAICILNFLRGGLNFDLRNAFHQAYGINRHSSCFLTSQRCKMDDHWVIKDNYYKKFNFPDDAVVVIGDVVATGTTLQNGLQVLVDYLVEQKKTIKNLVFFTVGCKKLEDLIVQYDRVLRQVSPRYDTTYVVYLEGRFKLVEADTKLRIGIPGTDFVRFDCLLAPEFELSQYDQISYPLERCTIYDAGSRAFDISEYLGDVSHFWGLMQELAKQQKFTLYSALKERWPEKEYANEAEFFAQKQAMWRAVDQVFLVKLYEAYASRWHKDFLAYSQTSQALLDLCQARFLKLTGQPSPQPVPRRPSRSNPRDYYGDPNIVYF